MISLTARILTVLALVQGICQNTSASALETQSGFHCVSYKLQASITPEQQSLSAEALLSLVCVMAKSDTLEFSLNQHFPAQQILVNKLKPSAIIRRMTDDGECFYTVIPPQPFVPGDTVLLSVCYAGTLDTTLEFGIISPPVTELSGYMDWFPLLSSTDYSETKTDLAVTLPSKYEFTSGGLKVAEDLTKETRTKRWRDEDEEWLDFVVIASDRMTLEQVSAHRSIFYSTEGERERLLKMITYSTDCIHYYTSLYGPSRLRRDITIVSLPIARNSTVAYYRSTLFVYVQSYMEGEGNSWQFNKTLFHEIAHFFWTVTTPNIRPPDSWINEGLAEYSAWLAVGKMYGQDYFNTCLEQASRIILKEPRVFLTHSAQDDYFYAFVPYIYHMLRYNVGDSLFFAILKQLHPTIGTSGKTSAPAFVGILQKFTSTKLDAFFGEWLSREEFPILCFDWQQESRGVNNYDLHIVITQQQNQTFATPVPVLLRYSSGDTEARKVFINDRVTSVNIPTHAPVEEVQLDADRSIIATVIRK
jgi:hypothetical protein